MATPIQIVFDCADPDAQAAFWAAALGYILQPPPAGYSDWQTFATEHGMADRIGNVSAIIDPDGAGPRVFFQRVPEPKTAKNRVHLDLNVTTRGMGHAERRQRIDAEVARLTGMGATMFRAFDQPETDEMWTVMADPEGNEFCIQ